MFPRFESQSILRIYQIRYCEGHFERCLRYKLACEGTMPPPDLLPDGDRLDDPVA